MKFNAKPDDRPPVAAETLKLCYRMTRRLLLMFLLILVVIFGVLYATRFAPLPALFSYQWLPGLDVGGTLLGAAVLGVILYGKWYARRVGNLLGEPYVSMTMALYHIGMAALRSGYRGGLITPLRKRRAR
ncbi:hypothetical protein [Achromobacter sp. NCFB-sbj8-Ac1-l]|uniref:hypothetical protein n=1 Tax=unclassified Achromobacter TaxID=2626865 RepID=UPI0040469245